MHARKCRSNDRCAAVRSAKLYICRTIYFGKVCIFRTRLVDLEKSKITRRNFNFIKLSPNFCIQLSRLYGPPFKNILRTLLFGFLRTFVLDEGVPLTKA